MKNHRVTWIALGLLVAIGAVAYVLTSKAPGTAVANLNGDPKGGAAAPAKDVKGSDSAKGGAASGAAVPVEVVTLKPVAVQEDMQAVGSLRSNESVILRPEVAGRISTIGFKDGQPVRKGQLLVGLDASLNEAEVAQYKAEYDLALSNLKRSEDLAQQKFISSSARETAASNAQVAEARLKLAQARLSKMRIVAPFDGVVGIRGVSLGDYVKDGADLVNVEDVRNLKVDFRLPERSLEQLRVGQPLEIVADALPSEHWPAQVEAINPKVDQNGRSLEVRGRFDNASGRLRPGMFVRVRVIVGERSAALMVPEQSIVPAGDEFFVFRAVDGKAQRVQVKTGVRRDGMVEVAQGLQAGDSVIVSGQQRLGRDGQAVRIVAAADAKAGVADAGSDSRKQ
jgi:membrane fusion protein (multidrug efflux system)